MLRLKKILKKRLETAKKTAVLCVGSDLRADDSAGMILAGKLSKNNSAGFRVFLGGTAPENLTGQILSYKPSHIIIVDSAEDGRKPGAVFLVNPEDISGISFSTHMMPLKMLVDYLTESLKCEILVIGIQPRNIKFGGKVSSEVKKSAEELASVIKNILR